MCPLTLWQVLEEYFKRGGADIKTNFVQVKGFHLLASQLKRFSVSFELMNALCSIVVRKNVSLKRDQYVMETHCAVGKGLKLSSPLILILLISQQILYSFIINS